jgi:hypothetical protein
MYHLHALARSCRVHVRDSLKKDSLDAALGKLYKDKIFLVFGSREDGLKAERSRNVYNNHTIYVQLYRPPQGISTVTCIL